MIKILQEKITLEFESGHTEVITRIELEDLYQQISSYLGKNKNQIPIYRDNIHKSSSTCITPRTASGSLGTTLDFGFNNDNWLRTSNKKPVKCEFNYIDYTNLPKPKEEWVKVE